MANRRNRQSMRLETPSPEREINNTQVGTPNICYETLTNSNVNVQDDLGDTSLENQLTETSQTSNEIPICTQIFKQKHNDRIMKMREEMDNKLETILRGITTNKSLSTTTNTRSETRETQNAQPSRSKTDKSTGFRASNIGNSYTEDGDYALGSSERKGSRHPTKPLYRNELDLDATIVSNEDSEEEDCHTL